MPADFSAKQPVVSVQAERGSVTQLVTCHRCGSASQQTLHEAARLTLFKCADCGWRYALSR